MPVIELDALDLSALLCSRVCHDVISPVGAIVNALEVLEEDDPSMRDFALELIKKSARFGATPVVMLSSKDGLFDRARGRMVGCQEYLTKPFTKDQLLQAVQQFGNSQQGAL